MSCEARQRPVARRRGLVFILAVLAAGAAQAQPAARSAPGPRPVVEGEATDMTGIWFGWEGKAPPQYNSTPYPIPAPFTPEGEKLAKFYADPRNNLGAKCLPAGGPGGLTNSRSFFPMEIIQKSKQVTLFFELMQQTRRIYLDGRPHPQDVEHTWMGHSIGHWEGNVLVVDTVAVHGGVLNGAGAAVIAQATDVESRMPYSPDMHLSERIQLIDGGKVLKNEMTIDDPKFYTKPMHFVRFWRRAPEMEIIEYICAENPRPQDEGTEPRSAP